MPVSILKGRLHDLAKSNDEKLAMEALHRLADLEIQEDKGASKAGALRDEIKAQRKELATVRQHHEAAVQEAAALTARVAELEPQAARAPELQAALDTLNAERQAWEKAKVEELTAESAHQLRDAESARQRAELVLATADSRFAQEALHHTMAAFQQIASSTPMPDFWSPEARKHSALFWQSWWTPERANLWTALENGFADSPDNFKTWAVRILHARLCGYCDKEIVSQSEEKAAYVLAKAERLGDDVLEQIQAEAEQQRDSHLLRHRERMFSSAKAAEDAQARAGVGRIPIGPALQESSLPLELHAPGCCCPAHGGIPRHLRTGEVVESF